MRALLMMLGVLLSLSTVQVQAGIEEHSFSSPQQEAHYKKLVNELRCLVCQNQNLADSNAELAQDLRKEIYSMIQQGMDDKQVVAFMVDRYGDFVLYRPPFKATTALLWLGPFLALLLGGFILFMVIRRNHQLARGFQPDAAEQARLQALLKNNDKDPHS